MKRRDFIKLTSGILGTAVLPSVKATLAAKRSDLSQVHFIEELPDNESRYWLGKHFWGNRLQDWRMHNGAIECLQGGKGFEVRTVNILSRTLNSLNKPARLQATFANLTPGKQGFCGFLLGIGNGQLDYRGAALAQRAAGDYGGFMAVIDDQGQLSFREFSDQTNALQFEQIPRTNEVTITEFKEQSITLDCHIDPTDNKLFDVRLIARDATSGKELGFIVRTDVPANELTGGISLVSSPHTNRGGARWKIWDIASGGEKITANSDHVLGPLMGCMHTLNKQVLRLTAQFMPIDLSIDDKARIEYRHLGSQRWIKGPTSNIEDGFVALFRIPNWQYQYDFEYRITLSKQANITLFTGKILQDPEKEGLRIALYSCMIPTSKSLDRIEYKKLIEEESLISRYGPENILFPHNTLVGNCSTHKPNFFIFCGDQYYETYPTRYGRDTPDAKLDTLYRWYLWYWTFRDCVRDHPAIVLADDHDVLQGNLWGNAGVESDSNKEATGGFKWSKDLVRMIFRMQQGHNPDPFDPTPIAHEIPVAYANFTYGGVSFAIVEDRKFKTPPDYQKGPHNTKGELLGKRQEDFLAHWATIDTEMPKICITASMWGAAQMKADQKPLIDFDANGYPQDGRTRAVDLVGKANALVLSGDQHLGMVAQQGVNDFDDGAIFFSGPAAAAFWQRWFEGEGKLENQFNNNPDSGNFIDGFGNKMRALAVANPKITYRDFEKSNKSWGMFLADNKLKSEGYGLITVDHQKQHYNLECWSWDVNPLEGEQFYGWPIQVDFKGKLI